MNLRLQNAEKYRVKNQQYELKNQKPLRQGMFITGFSESTYNSSECDHNNVRRKCETQTSPNCSNLALFTHIPDYNALLQYIQNYQQHRSSSNEYVIDKK